MKTEFKIEKREGIEHVVLPNGTTRPATQPEVEFWNALEALKGCEFFSFVLGWFIYYRLGFAGAADVTPRWINGVIQEFKALPAQELDAILKEEFPGDYRLGGK